MVDTPASPGAMPPRVPDLRSPPKELVLRIPVPLLRYRQRPLESGRGPAPDRVDGRAMPQGHVIHRTLAF